LILAGLMLWVTPPGYAQDRPPSPAPDVLVVGLPFNDTFDTADGWKPAGAWVYDPQGGSSGGGWRSEASARPSVSSLTLDAALDLHGAASVRLSFQEQGWLPDADAVALDVSLDGGLVWLNVETWPSLVWEEWAPREVDLSNYLGQVIRLRLRVASGPPSGSIYAIDNVAIVHTPTAPPAVLVADSLAPPVMPLEPAYDISPPDTTPRTLMGLHLTQGARVEPVLELVRGLQAGGRPLGTLKGVSGTELILNLVAHESPHTVVVYRSLETPWGVRDCPDGSADPVQEARAWVEGLQPYWTQVQADYYEITNECHLPASWLVAFSIEAMNQAAQRSQCLLLFSFATGNPEPGEFSALLPALDYALRNPCQPGRLHGIALHAYGVNAQTLVSESGMALGFRHRLFFEQVLPALPEAGYLPVYLTEAGAGDGRAAFECADVARDVLQYTQQLAADAYIRGFHLWTVGGGSSGWFDVTPCLPQIRDALLGYY
jgi:hypothetical protein